MAQQTVKRLGIVKIDNSSGTLTAVSSDLASIEGMGAISRTSTKRARGLNNTTQAITIGPKEISQISMTMYMKTAADNTMFRDLFAWVEATSPTSRTITWDMDSTATGMDRVTAECYPISITPDSLDETSSDPLMFTLVVEAESMAWSVQA